jgi:hypothetical protein
MKRSRTNRSPSLLVGDHLVRINECLKKSTDSIVELSLACCKANKELDSNSKKQLVAALPFGMASFCKYAQIGDDPRLTDPDKRHLMPAKMSVMYELHQFTDEEFGAFEAEGLMATLHRRADVTKWRNKRRGEPQKPALAAKLPGIFYAALKPNRQLANTETSKVDDDLTALAERFEMDVVYPEPKSRNCDWEKPLRQMRREAKKIVADDTKRRKKQLGPHKYLSPHLRKYAGFAADDVEIEPDADGKRIFDVLEAIGRADEFKPIEDAAYKKYEVELDQPAPEWMEAVADRPPPAAALAADMEEVTPAVGSR